MFKQIIFLFVLIFTFIGNLSAQATDDDLQLNTITTALPFMSITPDSRSGAMGDVGTALSASSSSIFWNTAILNFAEKKSEISVSYTPWLRQLTNDIHLSYVSGYTKIGSRQAFTAGLRYFSLGSITFTDATGNVIRDDKPSEYEITAGYAFKLSEKMSFGLNGKFAYSNLTGGLTIAGADTKAGVVGAADLSFIYHDDQFKLGSTSGIFTFGATINNVGNKVSYSDVASSDFIPMNLKLGTAYAMKIDNYNAFTVALDVSKLLVPTPALIDNDGVIISGKSDDIGVIAGMLQSFYDAPGKVEMDANGDFKLDSEGKATVIKNSRLKEEMREIMIATGVEYWYNKTLAIRTGFFYENISKGARQYFNAGIGLKYNIIGIDISYLIALKRNNPLANTMRFTLRFDIGSKSGETPAVPE
ncbi:MAG: type IX secretion system outer membrane channel protein PorV [Bacteroidota bacterium]